MCSKPWAGARATGTGWGWWPGSVRAAPAQLFLAVPSSACSVWRLQTSSFPRLHSRLWGLAEPQLPMASSLQPCLGDSLFHGVAPGLSPFPTARHTGHAVPGNFVQFPSLQGLWGKPARALRPCSRASHPNRRAGRSLEPPEGNVYSTEPGRRQLPAHSQHLCGHKGPRNVPLQAGASPALHVLLFGG